MGGAGHRAADFGGDGGARPFLRKRNRAVFAEIGNLVFPSVFAQSADRQDHSAGHALRPAYLRDEKRLPDKEKRKDILKNIMAMGMHRFGSVIVNGTDNLIMSAFVGLTSVGIYSNYRLVLRNLNDLLCKVYSAFTGSVGNLGATEDGEYVYKIYKQLDFFMFLFYGYITAGLATLFNPVYAVDVRRKLSVSDADRAGVDRAVLRQRHAADQPAIPRGYGAVLA